MNDIDICAREGCGNVYIKNTHNQKYCSGECCRIATNAKIMERYYEKKHRLSGKERVCKSEGCGKSLSRYNASDICAACESKRTNVDLSDVVTTLNKVLHVSK